MQPLARPVEGVWPGLVAASTVGFGLSLSLPQGEGFAGFCGLLWNVPLAEFALAMGPGWSPALLAFDWGTMLLAMMPLLLLGPAGNVWRSSLPRRRSRALALLFLGYGLVWFAAGLVLLPLAAAMRFVLPGWIAVSCAVGLAVLWSCSPLAQSARNLCHRRYRIGASGWRADAECLSHGLKSGRACVLTCWLAMIVPLMVDSGHLAIMGLVTFVLFLERVSPPVSPAWRVPPAWLALRAIPWPRQKVLGRV